jgi:DNA-binding transcriptional MocR family regulator
VAAGSFQSRILALKRVTTLCCPTLPVLAIAEFLRNGGYDRYLRSIRRTYRQQVDRMREAIVDTFPNGIGLSRPQGGFMLWCELPPKADSMRLFQKARAAGISIAPGPLFSHDDRFRNFIRLNCGHPWTTRMERSLGVLGHLVQGM